MLPLLLLLPPPPWLLLPWFADVKPELEGRLGEVDE